MFLFWRLCNKFANLNELGVVLQFKKNLPQQRMGGQGTGTEGEEPKREAIVHGHHIYLSMCCRSCLKGFLFIKYCVDGRLDIIRYVPA